MENDWLAALVFERMHEIVSAVNTLSIHAKLSVAGVPDPTPKAEIDKARERLTNLLGRLGPVIDGAGGRAGGTVVGADPQTRELALRFLGSQAHGEHRPRAPLPSPKALSDMVRSDRAEDLRALILYLDELRAVIEEQAHGDMIGVLGDR